MAIGYVRSPNNSYIVFYAPKRITRRMRKQMQECNESQGLIAALPECTVIDAVVVRMSDEEVTESRWCEVSDGLAKLARHLTRPILESSATRGAVYALLEEYFQNISEDTAMESQRRLGHTCYHLDALARIYEFINASEMAPHPALS